MCDVEVSNEVFDVEVPNEVSDVKIPDEVSDVEVPDETLCGRSATSPSLRQIVDLENSEKMRAQSLGMLLGMCIAATMPSCGEVRKHTFGAFERCERHSSYTFCTPPCTAVINLSDIVDVPHPICSMALKKATRVLTSIVSKKKKGRGEGEVGRG